MPHQAAWLNKKNSNLEIGPAETPTPGSGELLIKVQIIAFSPIEFKLQRYEVHPLTYPNILGLSFAGIVEKVGPEVEGFQPGDRITTLRQDGKLNDSRFGAFQQYALASAASTSKLLAETTLEAGAAAIANLSTIVAALSVSNNLSLPDPKKDAPLNGEKVLIYGGSSSCGGLAIRYARAAGYSVITTSSLKNHDYVASLGPSVIIDHTQAEESVVEQLRSHGPYFAILDTIGLPSVDNIMGNYISSIGGRAYSTLIPSLPGGRPMPENVERKFESYGLVLAKDKKIYEWFYKTLLPEGLASRTIVSTPQQWVRGGLEETQNALNLLAENKVSAAKLVMNPWEE